MNWNRQNLTFFLLFVQMIVMDLLMFPYCGVSTTGTHNDFELNHIIFILAVIYFNVYRKNVFGTSNL